jgi:NAD(P)-dependent dehydrogenase (short-subunit alcohol dehydrogenase family)
MDLKLKGKTAIVTGGGSNIGKAIALTLAAEGASVVIAELDEAQGKTVAQQAGGECVCVKTDVTDTASVDAMVQAVLGDFGRIDVLVNNVGWDIARYFLDYSLEEIDRIIRINYLGMVYCCRAVLPHMVDKKYGRVVSLSSDAGRVGEFREPIYSGMKAGVIALTKSLAREMGRYGITLNAVCPGLTRPDKAEDTGELSMWSEHGVAGAAFTDQMAEAAKKMYALRRLGTPQDLADAVAFLCSDRANFITGQTLSVSGGYSMM